MNIKLALFLLTLIPSACSKQEQTTSVPYELVDIKGSYSKTVLKNSTSDTLNLTGSFFSYVPYSEKSFSISIPPNMSDTLSFVYSYPDFIIFKSHDLRIFNGSSKTLFCNILDQSEKSLNISFKGYFSSINNYYSAYQTHFGSYTQESSPYYVVGDGLTDFDNFPNLADSINQLNLSFLNNYSKTLPDWFKLHESWRLKYNSAFRKYNVLMSKEFYSGKKIDVSNTYYDFEKQLPFENDQMLMNTEFLWYAMFYMSHHSKNLNLTEGQDSLMFTINNTHMLANTRDILKIKRLGDLYRQSKTKYSEVIRNTSFADSTNNKLLDSLIKVNYGLPALGKIIPNLILEDINGNNVSIKDYEGSNIIINFWASWCGPCLKEFPYENAIHSDYKDLGLTVVNICVETNKEDWKKISSKSGLQMINLFINTDDYNLVKKRFEISSLPRSLLINPKLIVIDNYYKRASLISKSDINKLL